MITAVQPATYDGRDATPVVGRRRTALPALRRLASGLRAECGGHAQHAGPVVVGVSRLALLRGFDWRHAAVRDAAARWSPPCSSLLERWPRRGTPAAARRTGAAR